MTGKMAHTRMYQYLAVDWLVAFLHYDLEAVARRRQVAPAWNASGSLEVALLLEAQ